MPHEPLIESSSLAATNIPESTCVNITGDVDLLCRHSTDQTPTGSLTIEAGDNVQSTVVCDGESKVIGQTAGGEVQVFVSYTANAAEGTDKVKAWAVGDYEGHPFTHDDIDIDEPGTGLPNPKQGQAPAPRQNQAPDPKQGQAPDSSQTQEHEQ